MKVTENSLHEWVRANSRDAQGIIVDLIYRLVCASAPYPLERRFPLRDSIGQPGPDGVLNTLVGFNPFFPEGKSYWEIGTGDKAGVKATSDYKELTEAVDEEERLQATFIFVTPLSARKDWQHTWKEDAQANWLKKRRSLKEWRDVRVIDGTKLIDWLCHFPSVEQWFNTEIGFPTEYIQTPEQRWIDLKFIGEPPPLNAELFIVNRTEACKKLHEVLDGDSIRLKVDTHFPNQMADFVSAYIASLEKERQLDIVSRCLIISSPSAWDAIASLRDKHVLIADFELNDTESAGMLLLERAKRGGHAVIFGGMPGGIPGLNRVNMPSPKAQQVQQALIQAGYQEQRARSLAQKSNGNLNSLLRCLQNLSLLPEWAQVTEAADLVIAEFLGAWNETLEADQKAIEKLSGNAYGEWIGTMRNILLEPGTPLFYRDNYWKVITRYEAWYVLGQRIFNEQLDLFKSLAISVLQEKDPQFELPASERYMANVQGKILKSSSGLRTGLAESLALLGNHPSPLTSCSPGKAEQTAQVVVKTILSNTDWISWASLNNQLPLLAEAAPNEFLIAVESALNSTPCPFDSLFEQEGVGITGTNYLTGLLWALETLAWEAKYLVRSIILLGELAAKDPGGNWANRPANSLTAILLPWYPQTCASISKRKAAVTTLVEEFPEIGWELILSLLPKAHSTTMGTRQPAWRESIPDDWKPGVTNYNYFDQVNGYTEIAVRLAERDVKKLTELIDRLADLAPTAQGQLLDYLNSDTIAQLSQPERLLIWNTLAGLIVKHRKFSDTDWALPTSLVDQMETVANRISPASGFHRHQRLFNERDFFLYESQGTYQEQYKQLEDKRQEAIAEIFTTGGQKSVLAFAEQVDSPAQVGLAFGKIEAAEIDTSLLASLIQEKQKSLSLFTGGYVNARFRTRGWDWVDAIDLTKWTPEQIGQLFAYLPFSSDTWERVGKLLKSHEFDYWSRTNVNPYQAEQGVTWAIDRLVEYDRPYDAVFCLGIMLQEKLPIDINQAELVLLAVARSSKAPNTTDTHYVVKVIKALQNNEDLNPERMYLIEWLLLPFLDRHSDASPQFLMQRLADDPAFYCEVIRLVFRSKKQVQEQEQEEINEQKRNLALKAYHLLDDWCIPPGKQRDGSFQGDKLTMWLSEVKRECTETGHLKSALITVGKVLVYTPSDPDGLWIHQAAAKELNAKDAQEMRNGYSSQLFNSRGVYTSTAGQAELQLAEKYRMQAELLEEYGFFRLASTLNELSVTYERDAEREAADDLDDAWQS